MRTQLCVLALALAASGLTVSNEASAIQRFATTNASGACQAALPVFEGNIRKRPTAVSNEGTASAFISCSLTNDFISEPATVFGVTMTNNTAAPINVNCTMVNGIRYVGLFAPVLFTKSIPIAPGTTAETQWSDADNGGEPFAQKMFNLSCNLPVGVEIGTVYTIFEDGAAAEAPAP